MRPVTSAVLFLCGLVALQSQRLTGASLSSAAPNDSDRLAMEQFVDSIQKAPISYQAVRRLEASSTKLRESAWMDAFTEYSRESGFRYRVLSQGGSERIRNRALKVVLESERDNIAEWRLSALTHENYDFKFDSRTQDGLIKIQLNPRRRDARLVNGMIWVSPNSGKLVRLQGRLSKSPSFWVRWVEVTRSYSSVRGAMMPVTVESTADIRLAGVSTLSMRYEYSVVDGQVIASPRLLASP